MFRARERAQKLPYLLDLTTEDVRGYAEDGKDKAQRTIEEAESKKKSKCVTTAPKERGDNVSEKIPSPTTVEVNLFYKL